MDLQFPKSRCAWLSPVGGDQKDLEETLELKLPENMPDIGKVLCGYGQALVRSKQWSREGAGISGGVMAWVLYLPEDGSGARSVECWIPFQAKWDVGQHDRDGVILAGCYLQNVDARSLSARKLMVRVHVSVVANTMMENTEELCLPETLPEDVQVKKERFDGLLASEAGEKMVDLEETVSPPAGVRPEKLLHYCLHPFVTDCKLMADRAVFRGTALGHALYRGEDGQIKCWDFQMPFSQYSELDKEYGPEARLQVSVLPTGLEMELLSDGALRLKVSMIGQYLVMEAKPIEVVTDAYSTARALQMQTQAIRMPQVKAVISQLVHANAQAQTAMEQLHDCVFFPNGPQISPYGEKASAELSGSFQALGTDDGGSLCCENIPWQESMDLEEAGQGSLSMWQASKCEAGVGSSMDANVELGIEGVVWEDVSIPMVTGVTLGDPLERAEQRPSLILGRMAGDSLWELAKANATTKEKIMEANGLTQEPEKGSWLLIPVP